MKFQAGDVLQHLKTQRFYTILLASDVCRLEASAEPAYAYRLKDFDPANDATVWVRAAAEMEDGRFVLCEPA